MAKKLVIIDANAIIHRAFHALPPFVAPDGRPTGALYGLSSFILKMLRDIQPDYVVACFDRPEPTFRHEEFEDYKATRAKAPQELIDQIIRARELLEKFGITTYEAPGFEADDLIATLSSKFKNDPGLQIIIVSGDLDTLQLVYDDTIVAYVPKKGISETTIYNEAAVVERYGIPPQRLPDFKGLKGDPSDNVPGVKGVGEKTATKLLQQFNSLENMYEQLERMDLASIPQAEKKLYEKLLASKNEALFSKHLTTVRYDAPIVAELAALAPPSLEREELKRYLAHLGFHSLIPRLNKSYLPNAATPSVKTHQNDTNDTPEQKQYSSAPSMPSALPATSSPPPTEKHSDILPCPERSRGKNVGVSREAVFLIPLFEKNDLVGIEVVENESSRIVAAQKFSSLKSILERADVEKAMFDAKPILKLARAHNVTVRGLLFDMKIAQWLISSEAKNPDIEKLRQKMPLPALYASQKKKLEEMEIKKIYDDIELPLIPILADMEHIGVRIDVDHLKMLSEKINAQIAELEKRIYSTAETVFNINSPKQTTEVLFEKLKIPTKGIKKTPGGALSTNADVLEQIKNAHPVIAPLLRYRELFKLKSTYIDALPHHIDSATGRLYTTFNQTGTVTGRISSENPNLQNIPLQQEEYADDIRNAFIAEEGYSFLSCDYSQIELRIAASLSNDATLLEAFRQKEDVHATTAAAVYDVPLQSVTPAMRRQAKALNFGILYGMGATSFAKVAGLARTEAKKFIDAYFEKFPNIRLYHDKVLSFGRAHGYVINALGRRRWLPYLTSGHPKERASSERMAINFPIQSLDADILKMAMIGIHKELSASGAWGNDVRLLLQIHDQLLFEVRNDILKVTAPKILSIMEAVYQLKAPLMVDAHIGSRWGNLQSLGGR